MNKKSIMFNSILFLVIVAFIILFRTIFSSENTFIGVMTITAMLMFLERDLSVNPLKNTAKLVGVYLLIGIGSFLSATNMWLALPINFCIVFFLSYSFLFTLKKPLYLPFTLLYLYLVAMPVSLDRLPLRLTALVVGAISIMLLQVAFNKNKLTKTGSQMLIQTCSLLIEQLSCIQMQDEEGIKRLSQEIKSATTEFRKMIYERRESSFYVTEEGRIKLNLSVALEKLSILFDNPTPERVAKHQLDHIIHYLKYVQECLVDFTNLKQLETSFNDYFIYYEFLDTKSFKSLQVLNNLSLLRDNLKELSVLPKDQYNVIKKLQDIPKHYQTYAFNKKHMPYNTMKYSYAIRLALGTTLAYFISDLFNLSDGRWMAFTLLSVVTPIYEVSNQKAKERVSSTIIGALIAFILFSLFESPTARMLILLITGYINSYIEQYRTKMIFVTLSAIGAASLTGTLSILTFDRILFVIIGVILALILNKFILPYKAEDQTNDLKTMYMHTVWEMLKEVYKTSYGKQNGQIIKNLLLLTSLIQDRIGLTNEALVDTHTTLFLQEGRVLVNNIYELYIWISQNKIKEIDVQSVSESVKQFFQDPQQDSEKIILDLQRYIEKIHNTSDKVILSIVIDILQKTSHLKEASLSA